MTKMGSVVKVTADSVKSRRCGGLKNTPLFYKDEHKRRFAKILSLLKNAPNVSLTNIEMRQCSSVSKKDCLLVTRNVSKNHCIISVYLIGSNIRMEMDCNSFDLNTFKMVHLKKIRELEKLENFNRHRKPKT